MRFARIHKIAAYVIAALGLVALTAGGELSGLPVIALGIGFVASWFAEGELLHDRRYLRAWNLALVSLLIFELVRVTFLRLQPITAAVEFAAFLQLSRLANRRGARDYQQITVLALLHLIAATVLGGGLSYALCFIGFVVATPWALTLGHLRREIEGNYLADARAGRTGVPIDVARILRSRRVVGPGLLLGSSLLSVPVFVITAAVFVLFPRIGLGIFTFGPGHSNSLTGLGHEVSLSGHGTIRTDPTIVLRVIPSDLDANPPTYRSFLLRGVAFDFYNGRSWWREATQPSSIERVGNEFRLRRWARDPGTSRRPPDVPYRIVMDPIDPPVVLLPPGTVALRVEPRMQGGEPRYPNLTVDAAGEVRYPGGDDLGMVYTAMVDPRRAGGDGSRLSAEDRRRYLQLPEMSPRVRALATEWTRDARTVGDAAAAILARLAAYRYTLDLPSGGAVRPLEDFLFRTRAGHCEYFSTAMAVLLRTLGVPTRNVTGFLGGTYNRYGGFYAVRNGDAHSWIEVYDPARGWVSYDPTPASRDASGARRTWFSVFDDYIESLRLRWRRYVVGFDLGTQARMAMRLIHWFERRRSSGRRAFDVPTQPTPRSFVDHAKDAARSPSTWIVVGGCIAALVAFRLVRRRIKGTGRKRAKLPPGEAQREAINLALALDLAVRIRGLARPGSVAPLTHALRLLDSGTAFGPSAVQVAERYVSARFGDEPLAPGELDRLRRQLREAPGAPG